MKLRLNKVQWNNIVTHVDDIYSFVGEIKEATNGEYKIHLLSRTKLLWLLLLTPSVVAYGE